MGSRFSLFEKHPPVVIGAGEILSVLGLGQDPEVLSCPDCSSLAEKVPAPEGGLWVACRSPSCRWSGDHFEYFMARTGIESIPAALGVLEQKEIRVPTPAKNPAVVKSYQKRVRTRKRFRELEAAMSARKGRFVVDDAFTSVGLREGIHNDPSWWWTTVDELDGFLGEDAVPAAAEQRRLGLARGEDRPVLAVPFRDGIGRLSGVLAKASQESGWRWRGLSDVSGGVGLIGSASVELEPWGSSGIVTSDPDAALKLLVERMRHGTGAVPVVVVPHVDFFDPVEVFRMLPKRPWTVVSPSNTSLMSAKLFRLASLGNFRIRLVPADSRLEWTVGVTARSVIGQAEDWRRRLGHLLENSPPGLQMSAFLREFGWSSEVSDRVRGYLSTEAAAAVRDSIGTENRPASVEIRNGFTVVDTDSGWMWAERGVVLAEAVPDQVSAYLADDGSVRHRGVIRHAGMLHDFDVKGFRKDPVAVVESVLLKAGVQSVPAVHPAVGPRMADVALYFSKSKKKA